jgi:hypothetical protein
MNRLVPDRPVLARVRRHVGALPHGLPTALLFTAAVAALMFGSFVVVDKALPVLMRPDAAQARDRLDPSTAMSPPGAPGAVVPATTATAWPVAASPRPGRTTGPETGQSKRPAAAVAGHPSTGSSTARTVSFRQGAGSPSPSPRTGGSGWDRATSEPSPSPTPSPRAAENDEQVWTPTPTPRPTHRPVPTPTPTLQPAERPDPTPAATASPTPEPHE